MSWIIALVLSSNLYATEILKPVRLDHPRDTMKSFMDAMNEYHEGVKTGDRNKLSRIHDAVRTMDLTDVPAVSREESGRLAAIFLKEVVDRIFVVDYSRIPDSDTIKFWRMPDMEARIVRIREGDREGQFVFSKETIERAHIWYERVKHLPYLEGTGGGAGYRETPYFRNIPEWAKEQFLGVLHWQWIGIFFFILMGFVTRLVTRKVLSLIDKVTRQSRLSFAHILEKNIEAPASLIAACLVWYAGIFLLQLDGNIALALKFIVQLVLYGSLIWIAYKITDALTGYLRYLAEKTENTLDDQLVPLLSKSARILVIIMGVLIALQNFGINVMSLLAGLGLGGLAFALAAKDTAANVFGSLMILFDRPFNVGDWIVADGVEGTVTEIGFRSTRIRTFYNSEISVPNNVIANANIDNMGRREFRRIKALLGVTYDTQAEKIEAFCEGIKKIIQANPHTRKDYMHVCFHSFGDFSLNVMVYCFLNVNDWGDELVERQNIYLAILNLAEDLEIEFAFPTQSLHLVSDPEHPLQASKFEESALRQIPEKYANEMRENEASRFGLFTPNHRQ